MKILLTGCNGQVGREIQRTIPVAIDLVPLAHNALDISNPEAIQTLIIQYSPSLIINTAAYTAVDKAEQECTSAFSANADGPLFLAKVCEQADIPLIHLSTDYVFNGAKNFPYHESDKTSPLNIYGQSKWQGEEVIRNHLSKHIILRTSWVFGFFGHNFVKTIMQLTQQKESLNIVADQIGCPTSARSIAKTIWQIIQILFAKNKIDHTLWGTYHYTNFPAVSWYDFAKKIIQEGGKYKNIPTKLFPITTDQFPTLAKRPIYSVLNCEKIASAFNIEQLNWEAELEFIMQELYA